MSQSHDHLGWDSFFNGCILILLLDSIHPFLHQLSPWISIKKWGITFIKALLSSTHKQWIFRNLDVHHKVDGLTDAQHNDIFAWIKILMNTTPSDLFPCHCHLLDKKFHDLGNSETIQQQLWITSMESATSAASYVSTGHDAPGSLSILTCANPIHAKHPSL